MLIVQALTATKSHANDYGWAFARNHPDTATRFVRGGKMRSLRAAFTEFAAALQFPWYFGENMAALEDCLGDLSWLADNVMIIVYDSDLVLADAEDDKPSFYAAIRRAGASFCEPNNPLHPDRTAPARFQILFQCAADKLDLVKRNALLLSDSCVIVEDEAIEPVGCR